MSDARAGFAVDATRHDPYKNFPFRVRFGTGPHVAGLSTLSALERTAGSDAITLARGVTHDAEFEQWANSGARADVVIDVFDESGRGESGQVTRSYHVARCRAAAYRTLPDLDPKAVAIHHLTLDSKGWYQDTAPTTPSFVVEV